MKAEGILTKMDLILKDVEWCRTFSNGVEMARNMIVSHATDSIKDEEKYGEAFTQFHHDKMIHWAKVLRILKMEQS